MLPLVCASRTGVHAAVRTRALEYPGVRSTTAAAVTAMLITAFALRGVTIVDCWSRWPSSEDPIPASSQCRERLVVRARVARRNGRRLSNTIRCSGIGCLPCPSNRILCGDPLGAVEFSDNVPVGVKRHRRCVTLRVQAPAPPACRGRSFCRINFSSSRRRTWRRSSRISVCSAMSSASDSDAIKPANGSGVSAYSFFKRVGD